MKVVWATDLHLNTVEPSDVDAWCDQVSNSGATALLLGGDISEAQDLPQWLKFLESTLDFPIFFVLGNHDYYGSDIATVRKTARRLMGNQLCYLPTVDPVQLGPDVSLVGHDGWGDCRIGAVDEFQILSDYLAIRDLWETVDREDFVGGFRQRAALRKALRALGDDAAETLRPGLLDAARASGAVVVLTHVPPFRESCWHRGAISEETWLPGFTCKAMGDLLISVADSHPDSRIIVLCGHTHGSGHVRLRPNLEVYTGSGEYGALRFGIVEGHGKAIEVDPPASSPRPN